jgi:hypothetical protein
MSHRPPWIPHRPPDNWTLTDVVKHTKTGMIIELTTIPLYLYAAYSIKPEGDGPKIRSKIRGIFLQEMLHLALSGNLLCALDGSLDLYNFNIIPEFPGKILYDKVDMNLDSANKANLELFTRLEMPYTPQFTALKAPAEETIPDYHSIGQFYEFLQMGLTTLSDDAFKNNPDYQFSPQDFGFGGNMVIINNREVAQTALNLIVEQGEGGPDSAESHYSIFSALASEPQTWSLYDLRKNPKTSDYKDLGSPQGFAYLLSLAFDAGYCYLLQNIQRVWARGGVLALHKHLILNVRLIMSSVLTPLAEILVLQRLTSDTDFAAPCFNYFPLEDGKPLTPLEPDDLHAALVDLVKGAESIAPDDNTKALLNALANNIEKNMVPRI